MKKIRLRIAALVGGSVLLTLLLIMGGFNIIISQKVRREADSSMRRTFSNEEPEDSAPLYSPEVIRLMKNDSGQDNILPPQIFTPKEQSIIEWCRDNKSYETQRADIDGGSYYVLLADPEKVCMLLAGIPEGRFGKSEDCAGAALLLCSDAGAYITGANLPVTGGMHL